MLIKERYSIKELVKWTRVEILYFTLYAILITFLYVTLGYVFLRLPWTPITVIGTAVAFIISFQNNAAYERIWEARKIWGGIVNYSRTWGMKVQDMVNNDHNKLRPLSDSTIDNMHHRLTYRHLAWVTALRYAMREHRPWEGFKNYKTNREWSETMHIPEFVTSLTDYLSIYLSDEDLEYVMSKPNKCTALLYLQSHDIKDLKENKEIWEFAFLELENVLEELFSLQGKSERIKNFPYPRQYSTLSYNFVWIFIFLLPFSLVPEFSNLGDGLQGQYPTLSKMVSWLGVPFSVIVSWIFHTMMRIGTVGENPFEGSADDVPISTIARGIEIDLRQMLEDPPEEIPTKYPPENDVQM